MDLLNTQHIVLLDHAIIINVKINMDYQLQLITNIIKLNFLSSS